MDGSIDKLQHGKQMIHFLLYSVTTQRISTKHPTANSKYGDYNKESDHILKLKWERWLSSIKPSESQAYYSFLILSQSFCCWLIFQGNRAETAQSSEFSDIPHVTLNPAFISDCCDSQRMNMGTRRFYHS